jgi:hypothetical protein
MQLGRGSRGSVGGRLVARGIGLLALLAAVTGGGPMAEGADIAVENLRVGFVNNAQNNLFKIGAWTPAWVTLHGGAERFTGQLEIEVPDDQGVPTFVRQEIDVAAGDTPRPFVLYARPGSRDPDFLIRIYDQNNRRKGPTVEGSQRAQLSPMAADETTILTLGKPSGVDAVAALPGFATDKTTSGREVTVARVDPSVGSIPARWYGYDAAEMIVLDTNDQEVMDELSLRGQGLVDWVARGGHLVVAVNARWQQVRDSVLAPILPAKPVGQEPLSRVDLKSLEVFAVAAKPIPAPDNKPVTVARLEPVEGREAKVLSAASNLPLVVRGSYGFGRVTIVGLDVDQKPFADWPDRALFWVRALDLRRQGGGTTEATVNVGGGGRSMYQPGVNDLSTQLKTALEQFPGVKLIPFGWVAFFIFLYILLIGPGDYFFLKKVLRNRMELTWITFPTIVVAVSLAAYFAAYFVKGRDLRVNKVDVLDVDAVSGQARGSTFVNLFSPQNRDYDVTVTPQPLELATDAMGKTDPVTGLNPNAARAVDRNEFPRAPVGTEVVVTWMGITEHTLGGMGNAGSGRMGFGGGGYALLPVGGAEMLEGVRIPIWSTKYLTARWFGPSAAMADSDLIPVGVDRVAGTVTNRLGVPMHDAILAFNRHVWQLGEIAPGQPVQIELKPDRQLAGLLKLQAGNYAASVRGGNLAELNRAELMLAAMFHDSQSAVATDRPLPSHPLHYLDLTGQLALDRPMLVARVDPPAATLALGNAPSAPKVEQTTMLRVILPLAKTEEEAKSADKPK